MAKEATRKTIKKTAKRSGAKKSAKKPTAKKAKKTPAKRTRNPKAAAKSKVKNPGKKRSLFSTVDQRLMEMATARYEKVFETISQQSHRLNEDRKLALEIGQRVLQKVRSVQGSFTQAAIGSAVLDLNLIKRLKSARSKKTLRKNPAEKTQV